MYRPLRFSWETRNALLFSYICKWEYNAIRKDLPVPRLLQLVFLCFAIYSFFYTTSPFRNNGVIKKNAEPFFGFSFIALSCHFLQRGPNFIALKVSSGVSQILKCIDPAHSFKNNRIPAAIRQPHTFMRMQLVSQQISPANNESLISEACIMDIGHLLVKLQQAFQAWGLL